MRRISTRANHRLAAAATAAALLCLSAAASAHHGEPAAGSGTAGESDPGEIGASTNTGVSTDTDLTPVGKDGAVAGWQMIAGSAWRADGDITQMAGPAPGEPSPTPYDLDFYGVGFLKADIAKLAGLSEAAAQSEAKANGFAVGAQCRREDPDQPVPTGEVEGCDRIPVIYRYRDEDKRGLIWEESYRGEDATDPGGFVAAVTWLAPNRALAVGGTGAYPRREQERAPGATDDEYAEADGDPSKGGGMARAWLFENGGWSEIKDLPSEMRALQAIDASPRPADCGATTECAIAGGMRQLWHFANGEFAAGFGPELNGGAGIEGAESFRFRVRDIRFVTNLRAPYGAAGPEWLSPGTPSPLYTVALTSGCCSAGRSEDRPTFLWLDASGWHVRTGGEGGKLNPDSYYSLTVQRQRSRGSGGCAFGDPRPECDRVWLSALRTPGGPSEHYALGEPASRFTGVGELPGGVPACDDDDCTATLTLVPNHPWELEPEDLPEQTQAWLERNRPEGPEQLLNRLIFCNPDGTAKPGCLLNVLGLTEGLPQAQRSAQYGAPAQGTTLSSLRLASADGDVASYCTTSEENAGGCRPRPDGVPDWAVGALRSSGRGAAYTTAIRSGRVWLGSGTPDTYLAEPGQCTDDEELIPGLQLGDNAETEESEALCSPEAYQEKNASKALYALPSYALNAYRVAGEDPVAGDAGAGWAVGDHGAILTRGGSIAAAERPPDRAGARPKSESIAAGPFDEHRPEVSNAPGAVPALVPGSPSGEPAFAEGQAVGTVAASKILMSRDGTEGWVLEDDGSPFYHYDGSRWSSCDPSGVEGVVPPDRSCAELSGSGDIQAVDRVPLERDSDPTNDDEFEAVALTDKGLYRYREGRWSRDNEATYKSGTSSVTVTGDDVAFTAPDDGWVTRLVDGLSAKIEVLHFDGAQWVKCAPLSPSADPPESCGDPQERLSFNAVCSKHEGTQPHLASAGGRVYLYAEREGRPPPPAGNACANALKGTSEPYPLIVYHDRGGSWQGGVDTTDDGVYNPADGGWDPGCAERDEAGSCVPTGADRGRIRSVAIAQDADGAYQGWAIGTFGGLDPETADAVIMRLDDAREECRALGTSCWRPWRVPDAANDYFRIPPRSVQSWFHPDQQLALPAEAGRRSAFLLGSFSTARGTNISEPLVPALAFDQQRARWEAIPQPWSASKTRSLKHPAGQVAGLAPDGQGGFWVGVRQRIQFPAPFSLHHYTDRAPGEVLIEAVNPARDSAITALAAGRDGTLWLGDGNAAVYRYHRIAGWSRAIRIPGWDAKVTTDPADMNAIAVGPGGEGVAVGRGGRIADLGDRVSLDPAATVGCDPQDVVPPCGTGNDLLGAAIAPDGSAIVAGRNRTLLWRPPGGDFRSISTPGVPLATGIVAISMPLPGRAWLLTDRSEVFAGTMSGSGEWGWERELGNPGGKGDPLTASIDGPQLAIRDIAVDARGHGYAVGRGALLLERIGNDDRPWRRLDGGYASYGSRRRAPDFEAVALPAGGGQGGLVGGEGGLVLTIADGRVRSVRHPDPYDPVAGEVVDLALALGYQAGDIEAWAAIESPHRAGPPQSLLHYSSAPDDSRLDPARALAALPDAPAPVSGELSFAAFGKQDCFGQRSGGFFEAFSVRNPCGAADGSNMTHDLVNRRIREELTERTDGETAPQFAIFTGDAVDLPGGRETANGGAFPFDDSAFRTPADIDLKHARWVEIVAEPLSERGLAVLGAIGGQDLARSAESCNGPITDNRFEGCVSPGQAGAEQLSAQAGANLPWRAAMARAAVPWEGAQEAGGLRFEPLEAGSLSQQAPDQATPALVTPQPRDVHPAIAIAENANPAPGFVGSQRARTESYRLNAGDTHYATDVIDEATDERIARIIVVDTSMRSLAASDPQQHPIEPGGQLRWLEEVLCFEGSPDDTDGDVRDCTREPGQRAIVVSNTPTYSYGPISPDELHQGDAVAFESILLKNRADVVVSGGVGWNGRYWALAPGLHTPCPGQPYRPDSAAPSIGQPEVCGTGEDLNPGQLTGELPPEAQQAAGLTEQGALPFVVSSTAGGNFNLRAERGGFATAENGFWRGYSIVRLHPSGDPAKTIVEQRPILDWVGIEAQEQVLEARANVDMRGYAREAFGNDRPARYYDIPDHEGITHRYHLLLAHPDEPWRACVASDSECQAIHTKLSSHLSSRPEASRSDAAAEGPGAANPCEPYLCLPERIGKIHPITGEVSAGNGKYPNTFALAMLSVGARVAAQPLVFKRSPAFIVNPALGFPQIPSAPAQTGTASTPPPPPPPPTPNVPQVNTPAPPLPPPIAPLQAAEPPEPQPPAPPAPPPPSEAPAPISLTLAPPSIAIATPTAVIQPPTPPVNPAPPGGARREARQRQAATQKSGADSSEGAEETQGSGGDLAQRPSSTQGAAFTRHDHHFTAYTPQSESNPWATGALYTGGLTLMALALSLGWTRSRPTPRRREPRLPAPAWSRARTWR